MVQKQIVKGFAHCILITTCQPHNVFWASSASNSTAHTTSLRTAASTLPSEATGGCERQKTLLLHFTDHRETETHSMHPFSSSFFVPSHPSHSPTPRIIHFFPVCFKALSAFAVLSPTPTAPVVATASKITLAWDPPAPPITQPKYPSPRDATGQLNSSAFTMPPK